MKKIELLAPAGGMESLIAAVQNGADAVYLGGSKFSARAYANNFTDEELIKAVDYCHLYDVKVYITLNTLLKNNEIYNAIEYCGFLYNIGVDALIIQDTGLIYLIRKYLPDFELHASTQMTVHNGEGALFLKKLGFKRIVLSRELSLNDIKYISKELNVETEMFIHGALCISYSGQCLMSSIIGGRSGNRGRCAQPCRLPYTIRSLNNDYEKKGYILSPKDMCTIRDVSKIIESGTTSLKIEGRMKRPEYVAGVVNMYRNAVDSIYNNKSFDYDDAEKTLMKLFNREGFSSAYLFGNEGSSMMSYNFPKNTGIKIGKVLKNSYVQLYDNLSVKDGIRTSNGGFTVNKIFKDNIEVDEAYKGDEVKIKPSNYKNNEILYKTSDYKLLNKLSQSYSKSFNKKNQLIAEIKFKIDEPICIKAKYDGDLFKVEGDIVEAAINRPLDREKLIKNLRKAGDTSIKIEEIHFEEFDNGFLPISSINDIRRRLLNEIEESIIGKYKGNVRIEASDIVQKESNDKNTKCAKEKQDMPYCLVGVNTKNQFKAALDAGASNIAVNLFNKDSNINISDKYDTNIYLKIPNIIKDNEFNDVCSIIELYKNEIKGIITANLGIINRFKSEIKIFGDYKLNVFNSCSCKFYNEFIDGTYLSVELNKKEIKETLKENNDFSCGIVLYGRYELMVSEYCPIGSVVGEKNKSKNCNGECMKNNFVLKDRMGKEFIMKTDKYCRCHVYNTVPTNLINNMDELIRENINSFRIDFIDESYEEVVNVIESFKNKKWIGETKEFTKGHLKRGVE